MFAEIVFLLSVLGAVRELPPPALAFAVEEQASTASAQNREPTTRAEALRLEREKKREALTPNRPDALQRGLDFVEGRALHLLTRDGFTPKSAVSPPAVVSPWALAFVIGSC